MGVRLSLSPSVCVCVCFVMATGNPPPGGTPPFPGGLVHCSVASLIIFAFRGKSSVAACLESGQSSTSVVDRISEDQARCNPPNPIGFFFSLNYPCMSSVVEGQPKKKKVFDGRRHLLQSTCLRDAVVRFGCGRPPNQALQRIGSAMYRVSSVDQSRCRRSRAAGRALHWAVRHSCAN